MLFYFDNFSCRFTNCVLEPRFTWNRVLWITHNDLFSEGAKRFVGTVPCKLDPMKFWFSSALFVKISRTKETGKFLGMVVRLVRHHPHRCDGCRAYRCCIVSSGECHICQKKIYTQVAVTV